MKLVELVEAALRWDKRALARVITVLENGGPESSRLIAEIYSRTGNAHVVGITGPPGSGKSTLVKEVVEYMRKKNVGAKLGVIAVDPTSPFTGGAILGDRIRMSGLSSDPGGFIRSMGSRGDLGGLTRSTGDVIKML
ncbi:MAG: methylmalonyl Co-A mutase-associated GTPase MeaB, partial [Methanobacteriota archaeon]